MAGFKCVTAMSVDEACAKLSEREFDITLLDWMLGSSSGRAVVELCRERHPLMPVIVISGAEEVDVRTDALMAEADSFLKKPFSAAELIKHLEWWLKRQKAVPTLSLPQHQEDVIPLHEFQRRYVSHVVTLCSKNLSLAAERLGLHRHTVGKILRMGSPREVESLGTSANQLEKQQ